MENNSLYDSCGAVNPAEIPLNLPAAQPPARPKYSLADSVCAWICLLLGLIFTKYVCGYAGGLWGGIFWAAAGALGAVYARISSLKITAGQVVIFIIAELFCLTPIFCTNGFVNTLAALFSFALMFYLAVSVSGAALFGRHFVLDLLSGILERPLMSFAHSPRAALSLFGDKRNGKKSKNVQYALLGLLMSVPLTVVVFVLLMYSDGVFEGVMNNFFANLTNVSFSLFWQIVFAIPVGMYLFGALFSFSKPARCYSGKMPVYRFLPVPAACAAVTPVCVFYFVYLITQLGYFTAAFGGALPEGYSYSEFARRGFFELCVIAVINLFVITIMQAFVRRQEGDRRPKALRAYTILISVFTLLLITSALSKMLLYIGELGMTRLRVYTSWFMILLAAVFVMIIILQIRDFAFWKSLFAVFTVMMGILCFGNIDGAIARYNVSAYQSGALEELDFHAMRALGSAAAEPLSELLDTEKKGSARYELGVILTETERLDGFAYFSIPKITAERIYEREGIQAVSAGIY